MYLFRHVGVCSCKIPKLQYTVGVLTIPLCVPALVCPWDRRRSRPAGESFSISCSKKPLLKLHTLGIHAANCFTMSQPGVLKFCRTSLWPSYYVECGIKISSACGCVTLSHQRHANGTCTIYLKTGLSRFRPPFFFQLRIQGNAKERTRTRTFK